MLYPRWVPLIYFISFSLDTGSRVGFAFKHRENKRIECIESLNPCFYYLVRVVRTPYDLKSIENRSRKRRHYKPNGIALARIRMRRGEERKDSVRCTVSWPHFPLTRVRSVETNLTLICSSPTSFICKCPDSGPDSTRASFSLSQSVETVGRESWERGWTPSS